MATFIRGKYSFVNLDRVFKIYTNLLDNGACDLLATFNEGTDNEFRESLGEFKTEEEAEGWARRNLPALYPELDLFVLVRDLLELQSTIMPLVIDAPFFPVLSERLQRLRTAMNRIAQLRFR